jgi:hypothetical protein
MRKRPSFLIEPRVERNRPIVSNRSYKTKSLTVNSCRMMRPLMHNSGIVGLSVENTDMIVALCMQQSQVADPRKPKGKESNYKHFSAGRRNGSAKHNIKRRMPGPKSDRGSNFAGRSASNGGKKGSGFIRPMIGKNRF